MSVATSHVMLSVVILSVVAPSSPLEVNFGRKTMKELEFKMQSLFFSNFAKKKTFVQVLFDLMQNLFNKNVDSCRSRNPGCQGYKTFYCRNLRISIKN